MDIGGNIRKFREQQKLLVSEVARRAGVTISGVTFIEDGRVQDPRISTLIAIARALGVEPADLLKEAENPKVVALPRTPLTDLEPEDLDKRLQKARSAAQADRLLRDLEAESRDLEEFYPRRLAPKLDRARLYTAAARDRWIKVGDSRRDPASNRFKPVREIADELGGRFVPEKSRKKRLPGNLAKPSAQAEDETSSSTA
jgi:transcriptional regulator with XRE-family HTH domain